MKGLVDSSGSSFVKIEDGALYDCQATTITKSYAVSGYSLLLFAIVHPFYYSASVSANSTSITLTQTSTSGTISGIIYTADALGNITKSNVSTFQFSGAKDSPAIYMIFNGASKASVIRLDGATTDYNSTSVNLKEVYTLSSKLATISVKCTSRRNLTTWGPIYLYGLKP